MIEFRPEGIYCPQADIYIDPWRPVPYAVITHAHSDHARPGSAHYLCHTDSKEILRYRLGETISVQAIAYGQSLTVNGVRISLHPAGHIIGSAQVRLEYKGEIWVLSGDYKLLADGVSAPFEPVRCHSFLTESTFGLPVYHFPEIDSVYHDINEWWRTNAAEGFNSVVIAYALGKSQHILQHLDQGIGNLFLHGAVAQVNKALQLSGFDFPGERLTPETDKQRLKSAMIIAPQSVIGSPWLRRLQPYRLAVCSGWMQLRGPRRRIGADKGFILSDHCDFEQLNTAVLATGATNIYVTHGYQDIYARWLREAHALNAVSVKTLFDEGIADITTEEEPI